MGSIEILGMSLPVAIGSITAAYLIYWVISTYLAYRKLQHIKGPWLASISPLWMFYYSCRGTLYLAVEDALRKYGTLPNHIRLLQLSRHLTPRTQVLPPALGRITL